MKASFAECHLCGILRDQWKEAGEGKMELTHITYKGLSGHSTEEQPHGYDRTTGQIAESMDLVCSELFLVFSKNKSVSEIF